MIIITLRIKGRVGMYTCVYSTFLHDVDCSQRSSGEREGEATTSHCKQIRVFSTLPWLAQLHLFRSSLYAMLKRKIIIKSMGMDEDCKTYYCTVKRCAVPLSSCYFNFLMMLWNTS